MKQVNALVLLATLLIATSCTPKPEGPGEKIGKGLDQILEGTQDLNDKYANDPTDPAAEAKSKVRTKPKDSRYDYHSDEWWREREKRNQAEQD